MNIFQVVADNRGIGDEFLIADLQNGDAPHRVHGEKALSLLQRIQLTVLKLETFLF